MEAKLIVNDVAADVGGFSITTHLIPNGYNQFNTQKKINSYLNKLKNLGWSPPALMLPA